MILYVLGLLVVALILIAVNGTFVAAEFSIISVRPARLEMLADQGSAAARRVLGVVRSAGARDRYIATSQVGLSLASLGLGMYAEEGLVGLLTPALQGVLPEGFLVLAAHSIAAVSVLGFLTFWHIVLGEMVPKSIALALAEPVACRLILLMRAMYVLFYPIIALLNLIGNGVLRALRLPLSAETSFVYSPEELALIVEESHEEGLLEPEESRLMQRVIEFGERPARQVMVSRTRVVGLPVEATVDEALQRVRTDAYTRYPVYERDMDHIVGIVHVKDLVRTRRHAPGTAPIRGLVRKVPFVPESMDASDLFEKMQAEAAQMAIVMDEHGGTAGIVTMEDLVEEIFGEVRDEFDVEEEEPLVRLPDGSLRVHGEVQLETLGGALGRALEVDDVETVNGLIIDQLGRPPRVGDRVEAAELSLVVEQVHDRSVAVARATDMHAKAAEEDAGA